MVIVMASLPLIEFSDARAVVEQAGVHSTKVSVISCLVKIQCCCLLYVCVITNITLPFDIPLSPDRTAQQK